MSVIEIPAPIKSWPGIGFAIRRNSGMTDNAVSTKSRISDHQHIGQPRQCLILRIRERDRICAFKFDTDRKIVAVATPLEIRLSGMPGPVITGHKLDDTTIAAQQEMRGDFNAANRFEIRMGRPIQTIQKERFNRSTTELTWRQTDVVDDQ